MCFFFFIYIQTISSTGIILKLYVYFSQTNIIKELVIIQHRGLLKFSPCSDGRRQVSHVSCLNFKAFIRLRCEHSNILYLLLCLLYYYMIVLLCLLYLAMLNRYIVSHHNNQTIIHINNYLKYNLKIQITRTVSCVACAMMSQCI